MDFLFQIWEGPPFPVDDNSTHLSLTFLRFFGQNYLIYPLSQGNTYSLTVSLPANAMLISKLTDIYSSLGYVLQVSYMTEFGETGESDSVSFDTYGTHSDCCK